MSNSNKEKNLNKEDVLSQIRNSVTYFQSVLQQFVDSDNSHNLKRASLLSYWINDYASYIKNEDSFNSNYLLKYKQKDIVQINFGYRLGRELGGLHYGVVLDKNNSKSSDLITVIPLTSLKPNFKETFFKTQLKDGIYDLALVKYKNIMLKLGKEIPVLMSKRDLFIDNYKKLSEDELEEFEKINNRIQEISKMVYNISNDLKTFEKLNHGTVADVGQIVTVSKRRIYNPKTTSDFLYNISLNNDDFKNIAEKLKRNFLK